MVRRFVRFITFALTLALSGAAMGQDFQAVVERAHAKFKDDQSGANANYIPILDEVPSELFGVAITLQDGTTYVAGDVDYIFSIQSVAKPFTMALVMEDQGVDAVKQKIGVEPTGMPFNSIIAIELNKKRSINPMVNAGAIAAVSMIEAKNERQRWNTILEGFEAFAGQDLDILKDVYKSEAETNYRNRAIANLLYSYDRLYSEPMEATTVYTKQGTVGVSARILAMMGATLANHGVNPVTGVRVIRADYVDEVLAVMLMAGFYDEVGKWAFRAGLPAKTGVGGGVVAVAPGDYAIAAFSPRVNEAGNSVRAMQAIQFISEQLEASLFIDQGE